MSVRWEKRREPITVGAVIDGPAPPKPGEKYDPRVRALEYRAYQLYVVNRMTKAAIATELDLSRETVSRYIASEAERRRPEFEQQRAAEIQKSVEIYEAVCNRYLDRIDKDTARGDEGRYIIQARERVDKLLGLDEPIKTADVTPGAAERNVFAALSSIERTELMRLTIERRRMKRVGPSQ